jgi:hypothetical protein
MSSLNFEQDLTEKCLFVLDDEGVVIVSVEDEVENEGGIQGRLVSAVEWKDAPARLPVWAEHDEWIDGISEVSSCADRD